MCEELVTFITTTTLHVEAKQKKNEVIGNCLHNRRQNGVQHPGTTTVVEVGQTQAVAGRRREEVRNSAPHDSDFLTMTTPIDIAEKTRR